MTHEHRGWRYKIVVHSWDLTRMCLNKTGQGMFSNVFEMYCHHLKIRFHIKFRFLACMTTWSCCAPLLSFPRCPLTRSTCPPHSTDLHCQQEHSRPAALCACPAPSHSSPLKILQWPWNGSSSLLPATGTLNTGSFSRPSSDLGSSLLPVLLPSPLTTLLKGMHSEPRTMLPRGADPGRGFKESLYITYH